jgi:hypothetical protein
MKLITTILVLAFLSTCGQSQIKSEAYNKKITRNIEHDINSLIPSGEITVDIMDQVTMSPRRLELQTKFMKSIKENHEWFMQQQELVEKTGQGISYDQRLGMTEEEWEEYKGFINNMSDIEAVSSAKAEVIILKKNDIISFKAEGKLQNLNSFTIDVKNNVINVNENKLTPIDTICVTNANNAFKTAWRGYKWRYSDPADPIFPTSQEDISKVSIKLYTFTLGLFENTGKTYIEISGSEISGGTQTIKYKIPIIF